MLIIKLTFEIEPISFVSKPNSHNIDIQIESNYWPNVLNTFAAPFFLTDKRMWTGIQFIDIQLY